MKTQLIISTACLLLAVFNTQAADIKNGNALHNESCLACHTTAKYTADNRKVVDLASLTSRVKRCDFSLGTQWFDDDIADVAAYLNHDFYKFNAE